VNQLLHSILPCSYLVKIAPTVRHFKANHDAISVDRVDILYSWLAQELVDIFEPKEGQSVEILGANRIDYVKCYIESMTVVLTTEIDPGWRVGDIDPHLILFSLFSSPASPLPYVRT
jgi:hypothetical protein